MEFARLISFKTLSFPQNILSRLERGSKGERKISFSVTAKNGENYSFDIYIKQGRINQKLFICRHSDRTVTAVYVNSDNRAVRSYIYTNRSKRQVDKFIESRKEGFEKA